MTTKTLIAALICLIPFQLLAQQKWGLRECIEYGLKNNRNNAVYENEKKIADAAAKEALSAYLPKIGITATLDDNLKVQESVIPAGLFSPTDIRVAFTQKFNTNGTAQLDQVIYDQSLITGLKANKFNKQQADLNIKKSKETIIYNIGIAYYQTYVYRQQLKLLRDNLSSYQQQMEVTGLQVQKGVTLKKDLDKVTVDFNNAMAQIRVAESNLILAENQLKFEMGYTISSQIAIDTLNQQQEIINTTKAPGRASDTFAVTNLTDYQLSNVSSELLKVDERQLSAGGLPKLTGYARYGAVGFGNTLGPAFKELSAFSAIGLKLSIPLLDVFKRRAQVNQAKLKVLNAQENLKLDEGRYELEYQNARTKLLKAQTSMENDFRNIGLAESVFTVTDLQLKKGTEDLTEWLNSRAAIRDAQTNYLNSLNTFLQAQLDLEKAAGNLNNFYSSL